MARETKAGIAFEDAGTRPGLPPVNLPEFGEAQEAPSGSEGNPLRIEIAPKAPQAVAAAPAPEEEAPTLSEDGTPIETDATPLRLAQGDRIEPLYKQSRTRQEREDTISVFDQSGGVDLGAPGTATGDKPEDTDLEAAGAEQPDKGGIGVTDVISGTADAATQAIGGVADMVQEVYETFGGEKVVQFLNEVLPVGSVDGEIVTPFSEDKLIDKFLKSEAGRGAFDLGSVIPKGRTAVGPVVRSITKFVATFLSTSKFFKSVGLTEKAAKGGKVAKVAFELSEGAIADFIATGDDDATLATLLNDVPALDAIVPDFMASDEDDTTLERKLKIALEGAGLVGSVKVVAKAVKLLATTLRAVKTKRLAAREAAGKLGTPEQVRQTAEADAAVRMERDLLVLGEPSTASKTVTVDVADVDIADAADVVLTAKGKKAPKTPAKTKTMPNFRVIDADADIDAVLREMAEKNGVAKTKVTHAEQVELGKDLGIEDLFEIETGRFNAAEINALKDFYAASAKTLKEAADRAVESPTDGNLFNFRKMMAVHQKLLDRFSKERSEAGRTLNVLGRVSSADDATRFKQITDQMQEMGGREVALEMAEKIRQLKNAGPQAFNDVVRRTAGVRTADAFFEAYNLGLISGLRTQGRNILGNATEFALRVFQRGIAARAGTDVVKGEATMGLTSTMFMMGQIWRNTGKAFVEGTSGFSTGKVDLPHRKSIGGDLFNLPDGNLRRLADGFGELWRVFGRTLTAADEFFKSSNYYYEMGALSHRRAYKEGLTGDEYGSRVAELMSNPPSDMKLAMIEAAEKGTFTEEVGVVAKAINGMKAGKLPGSSMTPNLAVSIPARFIFPFVTTVANITRQGVAYTPMGVLMPRTVQREIAKGGAARDMALTKMAMGSSLMALWSDMFMRGTVTGPGPADPGERRRWEKAGHQPFSALIGDKWVSYRAFEPIGQVLAAATTITERMMEYGAISDSGDPDAEKQMDRLVVATIAAVGNVVASQSFSRGASEFFNVMANPNMYGDRYLQRTATAVMVPRVIPSIYEMAGITGADEWKDANTAFEAIDAQLRPWDALPTPDIHGFPRKRSETFPKPGNKADSPSWSNTWRSFLGGISPIYTGDTDGSPYDKELFDQGIGLRRPGRNQSFMVTDFDIAGAGQRVQIDLKRFFPKAFVRFMALQGHELKHPVFGLGMFDLMNKIVTGKHDLSLIYKSLPDGDNEGIDDKGKFVRDMREEFVDMARRAMMGDPAFADQLREDDDFTALRRSISDRGKRQEDRIRNTLAIGG